MSFSNAIINAASLLNWIDDFGNLGTPTVALNFGGAVQYLSAGSGVQQVNNLTGGTISVDTGTPVVIDLATAKNPDGSACTFTDLLIIGFWNRSVTPGQDVTVGGGTAPVISVWGSGNLSLPAGAPGSGPGSPTGGTVFIIANIAAAGYVYNASTAHTFRVSVAAGMAVQVDYIIAGH